MAVKREMTVTIGPEGEVEISVNGVKGPGCMDFTKWLEDELGTVTDRQRTGEYFEQARVTEKVDVEG